MWLLKKNYLQILLAICLSPILNANTNVTPTGNSGFKQNKGQIKNQFGANNNNVLYLFAGRGLNVQLRKNGFSYDVFSTINSAKRIQSIKKGFSVSELENISLSNHRIDIDFVSMQTTAFVEEAEEMPGFDNYYLNGEEILNVKSFNKITYHNVYPNTDIEFLTGDASGQQFKYNIILHPGADISKIKFLFQGASQINKNNNGSITLGTSLGNITEKIPLSYYTINPGKNLPVQFKLNGTELGFTANYDNTKTLVIDPTSNLIWATYYGSSDVDFCFTNGLDGLNNLYIGGYTNSTVNIATTGVFQSTLAAGFDAYVAKFNSNGVRQWASYMGAGGIEIFYAMYVEPNGTVYLCGDTSSQSNLTSLGAFQTVYGGGIDDALLAKFNSAGQRLWCTYYGGPKHDIAQAITEDNNGNVIITGHTESISGIATSGAYSTQYNLNYDVFIAKFSFFGAQIWGTYYGESGADEAYGIACDASNNIIVTGVSASISGITTPGAHQTQFGGYQDAFISKFNAAGSTLIWATYYGGQGSEFGNDVEVDNQGNIFVVGIATSSANIATPGAYQTVQGSNDDSFLAAFTPAGVRLWGTYFGGEDTDYITDLLIDSNKNLLFCGSTMSTYSISTLGAYQPSIGAIFMYDAYFAKFNSNGQIKMSTYFGGDGNDKAYAIAMDSYGKVYISGETTSSVSIATSGAHQFTYSGGTDAFVAKFCIPLEPKLSPAGTSTLCQGAITVSASAIYSTYLWNNTYTNNPYTTTFTNAPVTLTFVLLANDGYGCTGISDTTKIVVEKCTDIKENGIIDFVKVYPNPANNKLSIKLNEPFEETVNVEIFAISGQLLYSAKFTNSTINLDVSDFEKGLYFVRVNAGSHKQEIKLIKN